jgi:CzcA family heavy metal efflux pump
MKIGITSTTKTQSELSEQVRWTLRPRLMAVPGVAHVAIWGQRDAQYQVLVDPERLRLTGVTLDAVIHAAGQATVLMPGGFIDTPNQRLPLREVGQLTSSDDLARTVVLFRDGAPVRLGDVAEVRIGNPPAIGDAIINDVPGLLLIVEKQPWGNTLDVTRGVEKALDAMRPALPGMEIDARIFRPATFIEASLDNLSRALWIGSALVAVVLLFFLHDWRTALISLAAIPLSLLAAVLVLQAMGHTLNTMVIAGLVIALGEVVDDAIIDVENILRRLRQRPPDQSLASVILAASMEVRSAVVYASFIVVLVMLPVFFLTGLAGSFFRPLALAYVLSILASLGVALTVTPGLSLLLLRVTERTQRDAPLLRVLKAAYGRMLPRVATRPRSAMAVIAIMLAAAVWLAGRLGQEFLPAFQERDFLMHWVEKPGTSLEAMTRITARASRELRAVPGVQHFGSHIARAELGDEVVGPNFTELWISLDPAADYASSLAKIQGIVDGYPGLYRDVQTYLRERVKEVLTGTGASIVVRLFGPDLPILRSEGGRIGDVLHSVPGIKALKVESQMLVPQIELRINHDRAAGFGLTEAAIRQAVSTLIKGRKVGESYQQQRIHDVVVWGIPSTRTDLASLDELLVDTPTGSHVRLGDVADVGIFPAPNEIKREGASRRIDITCDAEGRDLGAVVREIERRVMALPLPENYHVEVLGEHAARQESARQIRWLTLASLVGILGLLQADFQSLRHTALVMLSLTFSLVGGLFAAWSWGGVLSLGSLVGFVTVLGIAARNAIMLISHYQHLVANEGMAFGPELVVRGAMERLGPILMTSACAALALIPIVWKGSVPGHEIEHPMAIVILGGLATSTIMNLLLLPALFGRFGATGNPDFTHYGGAE